MHPPGHRRNPGTLSKTLYLATQGRPGTYPTVARNTEIGNGLLSSLPHNEGGRRLAPIAVRLPPASVRLDRIQPHYERGAILTGILADPFGQLVGSVDRRFRAYQHAP